MQVGSAENLRPRQARDASDPSSSSRGVTRQTRPDGNVHIVGVGRQRLVENTGGFAADLPDPRSQGSMISMRTRRGQLIVVDESAIECVDGAGNYVRIHVGTATHQVRGTLKDVEDVLAGASEHFVRVHRSTIVNLRSVGEFRRTPYGDLVAVLRGGQRLTVGRVYRRKVEALLGTRRRPSTEIK